MAKIRIKGLIKQKNLLIARAKRLQRVALQDQKLANTIKNRLLLPIKKEGILPSGKSVKGIGGKWESRRSRLSTVNKTSKFFGKTRSNLTFSGAFLNSFKARVEFVAGKIRYIFAPEGSHPGYSLLRGGRSESVFNSKIGKGQIDQGRDYRVISQENKQKIAKLIIGRVRREFKLRLKNL